MSLRSRCVCALTSPGMTAAYPDRPCMRRNVVYGRDASRGNFNGRVFERRSRRERPSGHAAKPAGPRPRRQAKQVSFRCSSRFGPIEPTTKKVTGRYGQENDIQQEKTRDSAFASVFSVCSC